jgi:putative OPT family oligopeptide transporter
MADQRRGLRPEAYEEIPGDQYIPYIPSEQIIPEFTLKSIILGCIFGIIFGAANAYLGLRVGLTISTSIPIAVMTVAVFALLKPLMGKASLLESNISKTVGSASSSLASGIIFTIPAIWMWGSTPDYLQVTLLAAIGGSLGVLFMIPLRRFLINEEHGKLPYPEGMASAEVLVAASEGGSTAMNVFWGMGAGLLYSLFWKGMQLWNKEIAFDLPFIKRAQVSLETSPALLGVGYILGFKVATIMVLGAALSALIILPIIAAFWGSSILAPGTKIVDELTLGEMRNFYIRYIGAGAVATAGIYTLIRNIPTMIKSFKVGIAKLTQGKNAVKERRTEQDLNFGVVIIGAIIVILLLTFLPFLFPTIDAGGFLQRFGIGLLVVIFGFFFVTVSARIVGLVGVSSNPTSGMIIATLIFTCLIFVAFGWTDINGKLTIIVIGTMVGVAASMAGDTSQELKTGFLLGATPSKQQIALIIGVLVPAAAVVASLFLLASQYEMGGPELGAPQANMMKLVVDGILDQSIPWGLVFIGVGITMVAVLLKLPALAFAVGVYLPLSSMAPIFVGGLIRLIVEKKYGANRELLQVRREGGILFGSGLVGGEGLMGVCIAGYAFIANKAPAPVIPDLGKWLEHYPQHLLNLLPFIGLIVMLWMAVKSGKTAVTR